MYKTIEEIRNDFNAGLYTFNIAIPAKVSAGHVFDENLSVKRNREMVEEHNQKVRAMANEKMLKNAELSKKLHSDVAAYIAHTFDMTLAQAEIVEGYAYVEKHSFMGDYFAAIDELAEMVSKVLGVK